MKKKLIAPAIILGVILIGGYVMSLFLLPANKKNNRTDSVVTNNTPCDNRSDVTGEVVTWQQLKEESWEGKTITIEGYAELPFLMMIEHDRASVHLTSRMNQASGGMMILMIEQGDCENTMRELPDDYTQQDIEIHTNNGEEIRYGEKVRVTGKVKKEDNKYNMIVKKIEPATEGVFDYAKEATPLTEKSVTDTPDETIVSAEGVLITPDEQSNGLRLQMFLDNPDVLSYIVMCKFEYGTLNNQAKELPEDGYSDSDIRIRDRNGKKIKAGDSVRVYGTWSPDKRTIWVEEVVLLAAEK